MTSFINQHLITYTCVHKTGPTYKNQSRDRSQKIAETNLCGQIHALGGIRMRSTCCHFLLTIKPMYHTPKSKKQTNKIFALWDKAYKVNGDK